MKLIALTIHHVNTEIVSRDGIRVKLIPGGNVATLTTTFNWRIRSGGPKKASEFSAEERKQEAKKPLKPRNRKV